MAGTDKPKSVLVGFHVCPVCGGKTHVKRIDAEGKRPYSHCLDEHDLGCSHTHYMTNAQQEAIFMKKVRPLGVGAPTPTATPPAPAIAPVTAPPPTPTPAKPIAKAKPLPATRPATVPAPAPTPTPTPAGPAPAARAGFFSF